MIGGWVDPVVMFMLGTVAALIINYPNVGQQRARIDAHAKAALLMAGILLAAGVLHRHHDRHGHARRRWRRPPSRSCRRAQGGHIPFVLGLVSMPLSLLFDPDSLLFRRAAGGGGGRPAASAAQPIQVAQAALLGQMTTGFPVSPLTPATFLIVGLAGIELGAHQRFSIPWLFGASVTDDGRRASLFGVFPL